MTNPKSKARNLARSARFVPPPHDCLEPAGRNNRVIAAIAEAIERWAGRPRGGNKESASLLKESRPSGGFVARHEQGPPAARDAKRPGPRSRRADPRNA